MTTALLIIDVQRALFDATPRPHDAEAVLGRINRLADDARRAGAPVVFIQHETTTGPLVRDSEGWQLERSLVVAEGDTLVRKSTPDAFLRTGLRERLASWGVDRLVICGYASEFCVDTTTRSAAAAGLPVTLAADAHTTHDKGHATGAQIQAHHNATLSSLVSFGPRIEAVPADEVRFGA